MTNCHKAKIGLLISLSMSILLLSGCSSTSAISHAATSANASAGAIKDNAESVHRISAQIRQTAQANQQAVKEGSLHNVGGFQFANTADAKDRQVSNGHIEQGSIDTRASENGSTRVDGGKGHNPLVGESAQMAGNSGGGDWDSSRAGHERSVAGDKRGNGMGIQLHAQSDNAQGTDGRSGYSAQQRTPTIDSGKSGDQSGLQRSLQARSESSAQETETSNTGELIMGLIATIFIATTAFLLGCFAGLFVGAKSFRQHINAASGNKGK